MCDQIAWMMQLPVHIGPARWRTGAGAEVLLLPAIRLLPRAGKPTITTHILVSSAWTPEPLVFLLGLIKSPVGMRLISGLKEPLAVTGGGREGDWVMMAGWRSWRLGRLWVGSGSGERWYSYYSRMAWVGKENSGKAGAGGRAWLSPLLPGRRARGLRGHRVWIGILLRRAKRIRAIVGLGTGCGGEKACRRKFAVEKFRLLAPRNQAPYSRAAAGRRSMLPSSSRLCTIRSVHNGHHCRI